MRNADGSPAAGRAVRLIDVGQGVIYRQAVTAADGTYRFTGPAGDFFIRPDPWAGYFDAPGSLHR